MHLSKFCNSILIVCMLATSDTLYANEHSPDNSHLSDIISGLFGGNGIQLKHANTGFNHAPHFQDDVLQEFAAFSNLLSDMRIPTPSSTGNISFIYDSVLDDYIESKKGFGPLFTERAQTVGKGKIAFGLSVSIFSQKKFQGNRLSNLNLVFDHINLGGPGSDICIGGEAPNCYRFEDDNVLVNLDMSFETQTILVSGTYGLAQNLDVSISIPIIRHDFSISAKARVHESDGRKFFNSTLHEFDLTGVSGDMPTDHTSATKVGIGDIRLGAKYQVANIDMFDITTALQLRIGTGNSKNYMGIGTTSIKPMLLISTANIAYERPWNLYLNLAYERNAGFFHEDEFGFALAADYGFILSSSTLTFAAELLGEIEINKKTLKNYKYYDIAAGLKWDFLRNHLVSINARHPLSNNGFQTGTILTFGYEFFY